MNNVRGEPSPLVSSRSSIDRRAVRLTVALIKPVMRVVEKDDKEDVPER